MRILIIKEVFYDDTLKTFLIHQGFQVDDVDTAEDGELFAATDIYDLLILDVKYSKTSGCKWIKKVRSCCRTPILMITEQALPEDEIEALTAGADYYLTKPLNDRRLMACIQALLRRQGNPVNELVVGNTSLNLTNSTLSCRQQIVHLSSKELDIIRILMASPEQIVSKEHILCRVWGFNSNAVENHVEVYVSHLRKKLKQIRSSLQITAIRRLGYLLTCHEMP